VRAFDGEPGFLRQAHGPGWGLVGDAGAFRDPITSHGITDALRDAEGLARAIVRGSAEAFAEYEAARDDVMHDMVRVTDTIASFRWSLDEVRALHLEQSRQMARGVDAIRLGPQSLAA
jgi:flavin-dependent dehydrogenase